MKRFKSSILFLTGFFFVSLPVQAARIYFEPAPSNYMVGDSFTLSVILDAEGQSINAVDIKILIPQLLRVNNILKNGSVIQLWVQEPSFSGNTITLTGGMPGGTITSRGVIARINFSATAVGEGNLAFTSDSAVFLNDGQGTKLSLKMVGGPGFNVIPRPQESPVPVVEIPKEAPEKEAKDKKRPDKFDILIGEDPRVFDGGWFISFFTTDKDSGIDHYEVKLGKEPFKIAQSPYLIEDTPSRTVIKVRAYDSEGNYRESVYPGLLKRIWWQILNLFSFF